MGQSLNKLATTLREKGYDEASTSVSSLANDLEDILSMSISKTASNESQLSNINMFIQQSGGGTPDETPTEPAVSSELEKWNRIIKDFDKKPYHVEQFEAVAMKVMSTVLSPILGHKEELEGMGAPKPSEADKALVRTKLKARSTASVSEQAASIFRRKESQERAILEFGGLNKIASSNKYMDNYLTSLKDLDKEFEDFALISLARGSTPSIEEDVTALERAAAKIPGTVDQSWLQVLRHGDKNKAVMRAAGKAPGFFARGMTIVGILFSGPLMVKNIYEAYRNAKVIGGELPLEKYGISKVAALTGNPLTITSLVASIRRAIEDNRDNPENLYELLEICKTISAYWLDVIFAITNALMAIIDVLSIVAVFIDGPLPIGDAVAGFLGFFLSMGLMAFELSAEHFVHEFWDRQRDRIKSLASQKILSLGGEVPKTETEALAEAGKNILNEPEPQPIPVAAQPEQSAEQQNIFDFISSSEQGSEQQAVP